VTRLSSLAREVKVVGDVTALDLAPADCLTDPGSTMATCTQHAQQVTRTANAVTRRATERSGGTFVDVTGTVCLRQRCPLVVDGVVTYRDSAHISLTWSLRLTRDLARSLRLPSP
jgi:SGNH domain-containing protein